MGALCAESAGRAVITRSNVRSLERAKKYIRASRIQSLKCRPDPENQYYSTISCKTHRTDNVVAVDQSLALITYSSQQDGLITFHPRIIDGL
jgi:hypothetical protein